MDGLEFIFRYVMGVIRDFYYYFKLFFKKNDKLCI